MLLATTKVQSLPVDTPIFSAHSFKLDSNHYDFNVRHTTWILRNYELNITS